VSRTLLTHGIRISSCPLFWEPIQTLEILDQKTGKSGKPGTEYWVHHLKSRHARMPMARLILARKLESYGLSSSILSDNNFVKSFGSVSLIPKRCSNLLSEIVFVFQKNSRSLQELFKYSQRSSLKSAIEERLGATNPMLLRPCALCHMQIQDKWFT